MRISDWSSDVCSSDLHGLAGARRGVPGVAKAILRITAGKAWRARGNGYLVMDRRRGQPLGLGRDDRVDRPALQPDLAAESVASLLVEIDVVVGVVEHALVRLAELVRKDSVWGKSGSVRLEPWGRR